MSQLDINETDYKGRKTLFVDLILPLPIPNRYTYRVPFHLNEEVERGMRVIVQFGRKKILTGVIDTIHSNPPKKYEAKLLLELLDEGPIINELQLNLIDWLADYYMCHPGEVLNAAIPSGLKLSSESKVQLNPDWEKTTELGDHEAKVIEALENNPTLNYTEISDILQIKSIYAVLKSLIDREAIILFEEVKDKYKPKTEKRIRLAEQYILDENLEAIFEEISKKPKQEAILLHYLQHAADRKEGLPKKEFQQPDLSQSSLATLIKNGILEEYVVQIPRFQFGGEYKPVELAPYQKETRDRILGHFEKNKPVLIHGITGSGKTEIYIDLISKAIENDQQVLYLLPEIALTTQIVERLKRSFGDNVGVYHSRFSDNERVEVWKSVLSGDVKFVVGVRSSLFLPFNNLGLVIVDEEHEPSYKQFSPAPRYHGRDVAIVLASLHNSRVLLGSATPSMESYYNAKMNKYGLVELTKRFGKSSLPSFNTVDFITERKKRKVKGQFSNVLIQELQKTLDRKEQAIIFQNRRGYSPMIECEDCSWIPKCTQCSVSLTYHQYRKELRCHYCGYHESLPSHCSSCGSTRIKTVGVGTEKLEEDLTLLFPDARVGRMDYDTTKSKSAYETIIRNFDQGNIDFLVGTQMLSKGLDFDHVSLVAIVDLDRMLHFPDFRAFERTFQLSLQVSGRAGRREKEGHVIIQTKRPEQPIIPLITSNDYKGFYQYEAFERDVHRYPPFVRLIKLTVKNKDANINRQAASSLAKHLREHLGARVLGPQDPMIYKIRNFYLQDIIIKLEKSVANLAAIKTQIRSLADQLETSKDYKGTRVVFDVDPN